MKVKDIQKRLTSKILWQKKKPPTFVDGFSCQLWTI